MLGGEDALKRFQAVLQRGAVLVTGSEVECLLARHQDARVAHPIGLLDFICEQAGALSLPPPDRKSWDTLRRNLATKKLDLRDGFEKVRGVLSAFHDQLPKIIKSVQVKLDSLSVRDHRFAKQLSGLENNIYSVSYTQLGKYNCQKIKYIGALPPSAPADWIEWLGQVMGVNPVSETSLKLPLSGHPKEIVFLGFGSPFDPVLNAVVGVLSRYIDPKGHYLVCCDTDIHQIGTAPGGIIPVVENRITYSHYKFSLKSFIKTTCHLKETEVTRSGLRRVMTDYFKMDDDFDAFVLDYFPVVHEKFSSGMTSPRKMNILFELADASEIIDALKKKFPTLDPEASSAITAKNWEGSARGRLRTRIPITDGAKNFLLNPYSIVWADGHGPQEILNLKIPDNIAQNMNVPSKKTDYLHQEAIANQSELAKFLSEPTKDTLWPRLVPNKLPIRCMNDLIKAIKEKNPLLHLLIRLLSPGVHISLSVVPVLEKMIIESQGHRVLHVMSPVIDENNRSNPGARIRTYYPWRSAIDKTLEFNQVRDFVDYVDNNFRDEFIVIRPYGGFFLKHGYHHGDELDIIGDAIQVTMTEDYHLAVPIHGVFGIENDRQLINNLRLDRGVAYAWFEIEHPSTRAMHQWADPAGKLRPGDVVLDQGEMFGPPENGKAVKRLSLNSLQRKAIKQANELYEQVKEIRKMDVVDWWDFD